MSNRHGSLDGPKQDSGSPAKQYAQREQDNRAKVAAALSKSAWLSQLERE